MKMRRLAVCGLLMIVLVAAKPVSPPSDHGWPGQFEQQVPDPDSALPWLRPGGHF